jgi:RNase H-fold protein (predicted Holliday junction resolvase)
VELVDERLTTVEAGRRLREQGLSAREARARIDSASAAVLLQSWLDSQPRDRSESSGFGGEEDEATEGEDE